MKYIKIFETKILDEIMDEYSANGDKNLTKWEKEYLNTFGTPRQKELEDELKTSNQKKKEKSVKKTDDSDSETITLEWESMEEDELYNFFDMYSIYGDFDKMRYDKLPPAVKDAFVTYLKEKGIIN